MISSTNHQMAWQQIREDRWGSTCSYDETSKIFCISNRYTSSLSWGKTYATNVYLQKIFYAQKAYKLKKSICSPELSSFHFYSILRLSCKMMGFIIVFHSTHCVPVFLWQVLHLPNYGPLSYHIYITHPNPSLTHIYDFLTSSTNYTQTYIY